MVAKRSFYAFLAFIAIGVFCIVLNFTFPGEHQFSVSDRVQMNELTPDEVSASDDGHYVYTFHVADKDRALNCIYFISLHQEIQVYSGGEKIYEVSLNPNPFGRSTGVHRNYINIPPEAEVITVESTNTLSSVKDAGITFYIGDTYNILSEVVRSGFPEVVITFLDVAAGLFLIAYYLIYRKRAYIQRDTLYLGVLATCIGVWAFNETNFSALIISNRNASSNTAFIILMMTIPALVLFSRSYYNVRDKWVPHSICILNYATSALRLLLHISGIMSLKKSFSMMLPSIALTAVYFIYAVIYSTRHTKDRSRNRLNSIASFILLISVCVDISLYYFSVLQFTYAGRIGMLIYIMLIGASTINSSMKQIEEGKLAALYKKLAMKDSLTGLDNRNAFAIWELENNLSPDTAIINLDLNDLKYCNDTFGHTYGDKYLIDAAELIYSVFSKKGTCYRVGGDEFCVMLPHTDTDSIAVLFSLFESRQHEYNAGSKIIDMKVAYGYAFYDPRTDHSLEDTQHRADQHMYEMKKTMKQKNANRQPAIPGTHSEMQ